MTITFRIIFLLLLGSLPLQAQFSSPEIYHDGHGGFVYFPSGSISFADVLVDKVDGTSMPPTNGGPPEILLKEPDYNIEKSTGFWTLGCGGSVTVRFTDNALMDIDGPDLYVFELGTFIEATMLEISTDGKQWINVGEISGGRAEVDIHDYVKPTDVFYYVRLTDLKKVCKGYWAGADIDAIGAIGSAQQVNLNSSVLFESASYILRKEALVELDNLAKQLNSISIKSIDIYGHTDSIGTDDYNITLSKNRANAIKDYISKKVTDKTIIYNTIGFGESQPVASNSTEYGRQQNRRVSIIIQPKSVQKMDRKQYEELTNVIYVVMDAGEEKWLNGYPKPVNKSNFSGAYTQHIDDILDYNGSTYFFNGMNAVIQNNAYRMIDPVEKKIVDLFPGVTFNRIDASCYMPEDDMLCFIKNDSCILFQPTTGKSKAYTLQSIFPGLQTTRPDAMFYYGSRTFLFFFDGMIVEYDYSSRTPLDVPKPMSESTNKFNWLVGNCLWPTGPDAIWMDNNSLVHFFKNPVE